MEDLCQDIKRVSSLGGALMEHFLEGIAPLRHWYINPNEKSNKCLQIFSSELTNTKALAEHFLQFMS